MLQRIKVRRDTQVRWELNNPTLAEGEIGFEKDTYRLKIGTGSVAWNDLPYFRGFQTIQFSDIENWPPQVTETEIGYLEDVTSNIQEQLNNKSDINHTHDIGVLLGAGAQPNQVAMWDGNKWVPRNLNVAVSSWIKQEFFYGDNITLTSTPIGPVLWFKNGILTQTDEDLNIFEGDILSAIYMAAQG